MTLAWTALLLLSLALSALFSGSETALYSVTRSRIEAEALAGGRSAALIRSLMRHDGWLLATLLVGNNVVNQLSTVAVDGLVERLGVPRAWHEVVIALSITPLLVLLGELFPKDLARRRPHRVLHVAAPVLGTVRLLLAPLALPLTWLGALLGRLLGVAPDDLSRVRGRERVLELLRERDSRAQPDIERLAHNTLELRFRRIERVMVPWKKVEQLALERGLGEARERFATTAFTRLPVLDRKGAVVGYAHQLEVLGAAPGGELAPFLRPLVALDPETPIDRALARLRASGQRAALVGTPARPLGWLTLKDLVEEITGELARW